MGRRDFGAQVSDDHGRWCADQSLAAFSRIARAMVVPTEMTAQAGRAAGFRRL
jgi:hypothetical protein